MTNTTDIEKEIDAKWKQKYIDEETKLNEDILNQLKFGGNDDYDSHITLFPIGLIQSPVRIPTWMFRKFKHNPDFELDDIEKVAMAHVIHFTNSSNPTGYIECSGHIENWCKCSVEDAHNALRRLVKKNMIIAHTLPPEFCRGHKRNQGYCVNVGYVHTILSLYKTDIWL